MSVGACCLNLSEHYITTGDFGDPGAENQFCGLVDVGQTSEAECMEMLRFFSSVWVRLHEATDTVLVVSLYVKVDETLLAGTNRDTITELMSRLRCTDAAWTVGADWNHRCGRRPKPMDSRWVSSS